MNSVIKISTNFAKKSSIKIFKKVTERLKLIQHEIIDAVTKESNSYGTLEAICSNMMDAQNNECNKTLGTRSTQIIPLHNN